VYRVEVAGAQLTLFAPDGAILAGWELIDWFEHETLRVWRSPDDAVVTVAAGDQITILRAADGAILAACREGPAVEVSLPLDGRRVLELAGEIEVDWGQTGHQSGTSFGPPEPDGAAIRRRLAIRDETGSTEVEVHGRRTSPSAGVEILLWPPVLGLAGILLRHANEADDGTHSTTSPQPPWLVRPDGTVVPLPFELGVSPLTALPDGRWLLPGLDTVWRDDMDEPLSALDERGTVEPLRVGGRPVTASRVLREAAPDVLAALQPVVQPSDDPWRTVAARVEEGTRELHVAIETDKDDVTSVVVAALPLDGQAPARLIAHLVPPPGGRVAAAP